MPIISSFKSVIYFLPVATLMALILIMNVLSPVTLGPAGILLILAVFYVFIESTAVLFIALTLLIGVRFGYPNLRLRKRRLYVLSAIISVGPIALLALNSLGQLELKDIILVILLLGLACFYAIRQSR